jgi:cob(I)alamin adenosyltransferase
VEAYGEVDELNAALGVARSMGPEGGIGADLAVVQSWLFQLGAELATSDPGMLQALQRISDDDVTRIEGWIDRAEAELEPLRNFVLPGGTPLAAQLHVARTLCRRAERRVVALQQEEPVEPRLIRFLNRLADLLFVWARWCNAQAGQPETVWQGRGDRPERA